MLTVASAAKTSLEIGAFLSKNNQWLIWGLPCFVTIIAGVLNHNKLSKDICFFFKQVQMHQKNKESNS